MKLIYNLEFNTDIVMDKLLEEVENFTIKVNSDFGKLNLLGEEKEDK